MASGGILRSIGTIVVLLLLFPCVPLARLWLVQATTSRVTALERTALILATCSQAIIVLGLVWAPVMGFATIVTNLFVMLFLAIVVMARGRALRWRLAFPCLWLCGSWLYAAAISSAV